MDVFNKDKFENAIDDSPIEINETSYFENSYSLREINGLPIIYKPITNNWIIEGA